MAEVEKVAVTGEDREAAASFASAMSASEALANGITPTTDQRISECRAGEHDASLLVQAFARHRQAGYVAGLVEAKGIAEAASDDAADAGVEYDDGSGPSGYRAACRVVADRIQARIDEG